MSGLNVFNDLVHLIKINLISLNPSVVWTVVSILSYLHDEIAVKLHSLGPLVWGLDLKVSLVAKNTESVVLHSQYVKFGITQYMFLNFQSH